MENYLIDKIYTMRVANKAQDDIFNNISGYLHKTITDKADLEALKEKIESYIEDAHQAHPRCSVVKLQFTENYDGSYSYSLESNGGYIGSIRVIKIKQNWKE